MLCNQVAFLVMILKAKVSKRAKRSNLLGENASLFKRLLHSVRNDTCFL